MSMSTESKDCRYCSPATNEEFIAQYSKFICRIITSFDWGGVRYLAVAQADDIFQELMCDWCARNYLHVYSPDKTFASRRIGDRVHCTFDNFVYQFVIQRLRSWRDRFNRQAYRITTECVPSDASGKFNEVMVDGIRYIYRRKFTPHISADVNMTNGDSEITLADTFAAKGATPDEVLASVEDFKAKCVVVYTELRKMRVVSKRNYALLFYHIVKLSMEQGEFVQQAQLAEIFDVSTSTISLMLKQLRSIPVVRQFEQKLRETFVSK